MQASCDAAFEYAHIRKQFGQAIGTYQVRLFSTFSYFQIIFIVNTSKNG